MEQIYPESQQWHPCMLTPCGFLGGGARRRHYPSLKDHCKENMNYFKGSWEYN